MDVHKHSKRSFHPLFSTILLLLIVGWNLFAGLGSCRLWDRDEPRNARCTVEMLEANDWVTPRFNDQLRTHKPILIYWMQMTAYSVLGSNSWGARLPSAIMSLMTVILVFRLGRLAGGFSMGFWSSAALTTSVMFVVASRAATPDAYLVFGSTCGIVFLASSVLRKWDANAIGNQHRPERNGIDVFLGYFGLALAILAKGPVGLVLPVAVVGLWTFIELHCDRFEFTGAIACSGKKEGIVGRTKRLLANFARAASDLRCMGTAFRALNLGWGILLVAVIAMPWYAWVGYRTDGAWLRGFFVEHNLGRAMHSMEGHQGGIWFYPLAALAGLFPWTLMLLPIAWWSMMAMRGRSSLARISRLGFLWVLVYMVAFSFAKTKLPSYITPCYPGAALLIGGCMSNWSERHFQIPVWLQRLAASVISATAVLLGIMLPIGFRFAGLPELAFHAMWSIGFVVAAWIAWAALQSGDQSRMPTGILLSGCLLIGGLYCFAAPQVDSRRADLTCLENQRSKDDSLNIKPKWLAIGTIEPSWVYYLKQNISETTSLSVDDDRKSMCWQQQAMDHLRSDSNRLILNVNDLERLNDWIRENHVSANWIQLQRFPRFLRKETMVVLGGNSQLHTAGRKPPSID